MKIEEKDEFRIYLKSKFSVLKDKEKITEEKINEYFSQLAPLPLKLIKEALDLYCLKNKFTPAPSDIFDCADELMGITDARLKNDATKFFDTYLAQPIMRHDVVISDWRMAKAFSECFDNFERFTSGNVYKKVNDSRDTEDRKRFVETVIANKRVLNIRDIPRVFKGFRNFPKVINVYFIGDYNKCKTLARKHYATTGEDQQYIIQYPVDPALRIEQKKAEEPANEAYRENFGKWAEMFDKVLKGQMDIKDLPTE